MTPSDIQLDHQRQGTINRASCSPEVEVGCVNITVIQLLNTTDWLGLTVQDDVTVPVRRGDEAHGVLVQSVHQQPLGGHSNIERDIRSVSEIL